MAGFMMDPTAGLQGPYTQSNPGFMMDPVEGYGRLPYYSGDEGVTAIGADASDMEADLQQALVVAEDAAMTAGAEVSALVQESRSHAEHRKFLYMVGAPVIVYAGLTNKSNKTLGLLSALVGAYVGIKNYQDEQAEKAQMNNLGAYGVPGTPIIHPNCYDVSPGVRGCPAGYVMKVNNAGTRHAQTVCCRRPMFLTRRGMKRLK